MNLASKSSYAGQVGHSIDVVVVVVVVVVDVVQNPLYLPGPSRDRCVIMHAQGSTRVAQAASASHPQLATDPLMFLADIHTDFDA